MAWGKAELFLSSFFSFFLVCFVISPAPQTSKYSVWGSRHAGFHVFPPFRSIRYSHGAEKSAKREKNEWC